LALSAMNFDAVMRDGAQQVLKDTVQTVQSPVRGGRTTGTGIPYPYSLSFSSAKPVRQGLSCDLSMVLSPDLNATILQCLRQIPS
jgi:hypothetical protein